MTLAGFLADLGEHGRVTVSPLPPNLDGLAEAIADLDSAARLEAPGQAPALRPDVAAQAAVAFHEACRAVVIREIGAEALPEVISLPHRPGPETAWAVDLTWRHLPRLHRLAASASGADPLLAILAGIAKQWPLSGVGLGQGGELSVILAHPCLRRMLAERAAECRDGDLLALPELQCLLPPHEGAAS